MNETDVNDYVSYPFISELTRTKFEGCFSEQTVQSDEETLRESGAFTEVSYSVSGSGEERSVSIHARGKPMKVARIDLAGYGLLAGKALQVPRNISLRANYSSTAALADGDALRKEFSRDAQLAQVFESDTIVNDEWVVTFQILAYPESKVSINGKPIESAADLVAFRRKHP